jgi:nucleoside-diphosphate-sugar epimerase
MKVVITGALGHIGSHLIRRLPDFFTDCEVVMIDNLATQRYPSLFNLTDAARYRLGPMLLSILLLLQMRLQVLIEQKKLSK